ncbi:MAG: FAD-dependent oxidoreductase [Acidimicrobiales bacterium]
MTHSPRSVVIVGAGIIGLTSAFRLARRGHAVTLIDPAPARGATWAAAGMIAASAEATSGERDNFQLQREAVAEWGELNDELDECAGLRVSLHRAGSLVVGWSAGDRGAVARFAQVAANVGASAQEVSRAGRADLFAGLSDRVHDGLWLPDDAWLDPDDAVAVLRAALASLGVDVVADVVHEVGRDGAQVVARGESSSYRGDVGVLATGWAEPPTGARVSGEHKVRPVRGATVHVSGVAREGRPMIRAFVRGRPIYLVARVGGRAVLGATSEERHEVGVEVGELSRLLRDALEVLPVLESATVTATRSGLRPASVDGRPFFEHLEPAGWAWSSGYYRHGVTLAPHAAMLAVQLAEAS